MRRHGRITPELRERDERRQERRRDQWCRRAGLVLACAILGPPFAAVMVLALDELRRGW